MPKPSVNHSRAGPSDEPTKSLALLVQVGAVPGAPGAWSWGSAGGEGGMSAMLARFALFRAARWFSERKRRAARPPLLGSGSEPGGELLGSLQIAPQQWERLARDAAQARVLPRLRLALIEPERFPLILDLVGDELAIEFGVRQRGEPAQIGRGGGRNHADPL